jgi:predicted small lipoprotein YifL
MALIALVSMTCLLGCGQSGPLVLPEQAADEASEPDDDERESQ